VSDEDPKSRQQLGRGLSALFGEDKEDYASLDAVRQAKNVPIEFLRPNRFQPRRVFDEEEIESLVASIAEHGVLQPILVRRDPNNSNAYEIVAGERRWRAAQKAKLHEVPVLIKELDDQHALEIAIVENVQRQNLNPIEEGEGYRRLIEEFGNRQEDLAKIIGKSRSHIANTMRLLTLPDEVRGLVETGQISAGHARALIGSDNPGELAKSIVKKGLNVRQTERLVKKTSATGPKATRRAPAEKDPDTVILEHDLSNLLGLKVTFNLHGDGGELIIHYDSIDQLDDVLHRLTRESR
jgi:ParB family chromosome partitioning protein